MTYEDLDANLRTAGAEDQLTEAREYAAGAEEESARERAHADELESVYGELEGAATSRRVADGMLAAAEQRFTWAVRDAIRAEIPVSEIAKLSGLSRSRIYQIRDGRR